MRVILISIDGFAGFYWNDPRARLPTLRRLAERGVVSAQMEAVCPSTTWPTHVTLVTGVEPRVHGVAANSLLNRATGQPEDLTGDPIYDADELIRVPTLYDCAYAAGLRTGAIDWPATRRARALNFNLPFFKDQIVFESQTAPAAWRELSELGYPVERQGDWAQQPMRFLKDAMVADLAAKIVMRHELDLVLVHFLCADSFQHLYGPRSPEAYWALEYIDEKIHSLLQAVQADDGQTAICVVSDHGFLPVTREIRINVWLRKHGVLTLTEQGTIDQLEAWFVMNHGVGYLYLLGSGDRGRLARDLASALRTVEGVSAVWTEGEYPSLGIPAVLENPQVGDLLLEAAPGYCFSDEMIGRDVVAPSKYRGTHGQRPSYPDNRAFFLSVGPGITRGRELGAIRSRDVAPSVAALLGINMNQAEGRTLTEIFE